MRPPNWTNKSVAQLRRERLKYLYAPWCPYFRSSWTGQLDALILNRECEEEATSRERWWCWPPAVKVLRAVGLRCRTCAPKREYGRHAQRGLPHPQRTHDQISFVARSMILKTAPTRASESPRLKEGEIWKAAWIDETPRGRCVRREGFAMFSRGEWTLHMTEPGSSSEGTDDRGARAIRRRCPRDASPNNGLQRCVDQMPHEARMGDRPANRTAMGRRRQALVDRDDWKRVRGAVWGDVRRRATNLDQLSRRRGCHYRECAILFTRPRGARTCGPEHPARQSRSGRSVPEAGHIRPAFFMS